VASKTWVLDHLSPSGLAALAYNPNLVNLTLARKPASTCLLLGHHAKGRHPIDPTLTPHALPEQALKAIVTKGPAWRTLDLDLFELSPEALKRVLEAGTSVSALKVMFGAPFKQLVSEERWNRDLFCRRRWVTSIYLGVAVKPGPQLRDLPLAPPIYRLD